MARSQRKYDHEYKVQAVKHAQENGGAQTAQKLGNSSRTLPPPLPPLSTALLDI